MRFFREKKVLCDFVYDAYLITFVPLYLNLLNLIYILVEVFLHLYTA